MNILVIDDNKEVRDSLFDLLQTFGHSMATAPNGQAGFDFYTEEDNDRLVELIFVDADMPICDGWTFIEKIRKSGYDVPICMISGTEPNANQKEYLEMHNVRFILKGVGLCTQMVQYINLVKLDHD